MGLEGSSLRTPQGVKSAVGYLACGPPMPCSSSLRQALCTDPENIEEILPLACRLSLKWRRTSDDIFVAVEATQQATPTQQLRGTYAVAVCGGMHLIPMSKARFLQCRDRGFLQRGRP